MKERTAWDRLEVSQNRISHRTAQLRVTSRVLYRIEHYTSLPVIAIAIIVAMIGLIAAGGAIGFPTGWVAGFEVSASTVTIVMLFAIQHTQGREQAAVQRKLDEILRALPGADESLMMLEEAPPKAMHDVAEEQRDVRSMSPYTEAEQAPHDGRKLAHPIITEDQ
ncbi:MAG: low affinity iron permease family protein [Acidimicrobiales bacterium]